MKKSYEVTDIDKSITTCCKTLLIKSDNALFDKCRFAIDVFEFSQTPLWGMSEDQKEHMLEGMALMYQVMNNKEFLVNYKPQ